MKKIILMCLVLLAGVIFSGIGGEARRFTTMSVSEAKIKFGKLEFNEKEFFSGTIETRAKMAASLVEKNPFKGKTIHSVFEALGPSDGHYFSERIPAYFIFRREKNNEDSWQILFMPDENDKIKETVIHKNCCYRAAGKLLDFVF